MGKIWLGCYVDPTLLVHSSFFFFLFFFFFFVGPALENCQPCRVSVTVNEIP